MSSGPTGTKRAGVFHMMRAGSQAKLVLAVGALALAGAGCTGCGNVAPECDGVIVRFVTPSDGVTVNATTEVVVKAENEKGEPVELGAAELKTRLTTAMNFSSGREGTIDGANATFSAVPLEVGANILRATVTQKGKACEATNTITVVVSDTALTPSVTAFTFQGDANNDKTLNGIELATGAQVVAQLTVMNGEGGRVSVKNVSGGNAEVGTGTVSGGTATVTLSLPTASDASFILFAEVTANGKKNDATGNPASQVTLVIDRSGPSVMLLSPSKLLQGPADDADLMTAPFQLRTLASATGDVATIEISLSGGATPQTTGPLPPSSGSVSKDFDVPAAGTVVYTVTATAKDAAGNTAVDSKMVTVDYDAPTVNITSPTAAGGPYSMFTLPIAVMVGGADGQQVSVSTTMNGSTRLLGQFLVTNGMASGNANFLPGTQTVAATVTDAAGNASTPDTEVIVVNTPTVGCPLIFSRPVSNPTMLTRLDDSNTGMPDLQYQFEVTSNAACASKAVSLFVPGQSTAVATGTTNSSGVFRFAAISLADSMGAPVVLQAEIDDGAGNRTRASQTVVVNLTKPSIVVPTSGTLNAALDIDRATPGVQRSLQYAPAPPNGGSTTICSDTALQGFTSGPCPDGSGFILATMVAPTTPSFTFPNGTYRLKPVFVSGAVADTGDYTSYVVDEIRPTVTAVTFTGDANADKILNGMEQATGAPEVVITMTGVEANRPVTVRDAANSQVVGTGMSNANGMATVSLTGLNASATTEATFNLVVEVIDAAGNGNKTANGTPADPLNMAALVSLRIDRVKPSVNLTSPTKLQLGILDDGDGAMTGYQINVGGVVPADVGTNGVNVALSGGSTQMANLTPSSGNVTHVFSVASMGTTNYTITVTATDTAGNVGTPATVNVTVDTEPPVVTLVDPNPAGSPYPSFSIATLVNVVGANGSTATIFSKVGAAAETQLDSLPVNSGGVASGTVVYPSGTQVVRAEVKDAAGNVGGSSQTITVAGMGCSVQITSPSSHPAVMNKTNDSVPSTAATLDYTLAGTSSNCPNATVTVLSGDVGSQTTLGTTTTNGSGAFTFNLQLPEGPARIEVAMNVGAPTSDHIDMTVDLTDPVVSAVVPTGANLFFVNPSNEFLVPPALSNYVADTNNSMAGAQYIHNLSVAGGVGGTASVEYNGMTVGGPQSISTDPQTLAIPVNLTHGTMGTLNLIVKDAAGNQVVQTSTAKVDVIVPAFPVTSAALVAGKERLAEATVSWTGSFDDGTTPGDPVKYDIRWTTAVVAAGGAASHNEFFDSTKVRAEAIKTESDPLSLTISVPPLLASPSLAGAANLNSYYFYVRAKDDVGNYSTFGAGTKVDSPLMAFAFSNPRMGAASTDEFGRSLAVGSVNNDSIDDLVVSMGATGVNSILVYYGADAGFSTTTPQTISCPANPAACASGDRFGSDVSVGNVGDGPGGASNDILVGARSGARAFLFFGNPSGATVDTSAANFVEFRGAAGSDFGRSARMIEDINGDGKKEIVIGAPFDNANRGRVYLFLSRTVADWKALPNPITTANADRRFEGPSTPASAFFGVNRNGFGSVLADGGVPDILLPSSYQPVNKLFVFSGAQVAGAGTGTAFTTGTDVMNPDQSSQMLTSPAADPGATLTGFGAAASGMHDVIGSVAGDLVVGHASLGRVYVYADRTGIGFPSTPTSTIDGRADCNPVSPPSLCLFGQTVQLYDFSGDGRRDMLVGENTISTLTSSAWLFLNRPVGGAEFDTKAGAGFWQARVNSVAQGKIGIGVAAGDFNGDGKTDIAFADDKDGVGKVFIWQ